MEIVLDKKQYADWKVYAVTKIKSMYGFRIKLIYDDETTDVQQKSGFKTKKEANEVRDRVIAELYNHSYVVYSNIKVAEYFNYWLEEVMKKREKFSYNSYMSYRNIIKNYIIPSYGNLKMTSINQAHIRRIYNKVALKSQSIVKLLKTIMNNALEYAKYKNVVSINMAIGVDLPKNIKKEPYRILNINSSQTLTIKQTQELIKSAKDTPIYLQILFALLMGLRLSEINGLKYSNIDYVNRKLFIETQLGVDLKKNDTEYKKKTKTKQEVQLKTRNSRRTLDIPDLLFEAILEQKQIYEKNRKRRINDKTCPFLDDGYICCSTYGHSRSRGFHQKYYKQLLKDKNLPNIRFHDLRHTYSTILLQSNFNEKAVSQLLGHSSEIITIDVYCDANEIIYDCLDILEPYIESIIPEELEKNMVYDYTNIEIDTYCEHFMNELKLA